MNSHKPKELEVRCGECLLYGAIQGLADGLILVDSSDRIFHLNRRAQEMLELGSRHIVGTRMSDALRHPDLTAFWRSAASETSPAVADLTFPAGQSIRATVSLCLSASREPIGRALLLRDVTDERRVRLDLTNSVAQRLMDLAGPGDDDPVSAQLTRREREVLRLVAEGLTNALIAERLNISPNTVATHVKNLYEKLDVAGRAQAAAWAVTHGLRPQPR